MKKKAKKDEYWIQKAIKKPGRVRTYLKRVYGSKAFTKEGEIKEEYIDKAIKEIKSRPESKRDRSLLSALYLAKRLKKM